MEPAKKLNLTQGRVISLSGSDSPKKSGNLKYFLIAALIAALVMGGHELVRNVGLPPELSRFSKRCPPKYEDLANSRKWQDVTPAPMAANTGRRILQFIETGVVIYYDACHMTSHCPPHWHIPVQRDKGIGSRLLPKHFKYVNADGYAVKKGSNSSHIYVCK